MSVDLERIRQILTRAIGEGREALLETEGLDLLAAMGLPFPEHQFVRSSRELARTTLLPGDRVVVKVISREILHKSDVGGVEIVFNKKSAIRASIKGMEQRFEGKAVDGYTINRFVPYDRSLGSELLVGMHWTEDFGAVITYGAGGIYTEHLARSFASGRATAMISPALAHGVDIEKAVATVAVTPLITGQLRGQKPRIDIGQIRDAIERMMDVAKAFMPEMISEFEMNPMVISEGRLVALDVLLKLGSGRPREKDPERPTHKMGYLLKPSSAALMGVSERINPGHIILNNLIREGFPRDRIYVIKPDTEQIEGCRCYPTIESLPEKVDMAVLAIAAAQIPDAVSDFIEHQRAESLIVIPGGLGEKAGSQERVEHMRSVLRESRSSDWRGPIINGGNCLGIQSRPGRYNTMFIPEYKLPVPPGDFSPIAIISQSGAFAISRASKLGWLAPKYSITVGNQIDVTVGDYLTYLKQESDIDLFAVYVEGFGPGDGLLCLEAVRDITESGRTVLLYRAGRTAEGARASASHTASIAGNYVVSHDLFTAAGAVVVESIGDFEDLITLFALLRGKAVSGWRLGAVSNAGFECVAIADNAGRFEIPPFSPATNARLQEIFAKARIDAIVDVHNPLDLTPMAGDAAYEEAVRAVLEDETIDAAVIGGVPLTVALNTLAAGAGHTEDITRPDSYPMRLGRLMQESSKPWVAVVDSGLLYDPLVRHLEAAGIPTFREADRALRALSSYCEARRRTSSARMNP